MLFEPATTLDMGIATGGQTREESERILQKFFDILRLSIRMIVTNSTLFTLYSNYPIATTLQTL